MESLCKDNRPEMIRTPSHEKAGDMDDPVPRTAIPRDRTSEYIHCQFEYFHDGERADITSSFLGLSSEARVFLKHFSATASPLAVDPLNTSAKPPAMGSSLSTLCTP